MHRSILAIGLGLLAIQGCATKNYGRVGTVTDFERQTMSCREIQLEQAKVNGFTQAVEKESEFSGRSILSFLGDFGIGNMIEKSSAMESADNRARQLQTLSDLRRCPEATPQAATASAPLPTASR
ncbi:MULTISPECIES: hypothetical protein [unclassified Cupriavidus]|uniref:hypothetical protein n=1 Tax=unclassified Cupriavidus TaxID=2640874 RepID=UPI00055BA605|nr:MULTISPECIES: hypothetical protein [unclassified Cupriavidus]MBP0632215.1 hypothetical protein [Cupriavidus sp. AcVe19-1a]MBP0638095.1 hypothetical protein [Cupriavidus sp. AcVe19-6a]